MGKPINWGYVAGGIGNGLMQYMAARDQQQQREQDRAARNDEWDRRFQANRQYQTERDDRQFSDSLALLRERMMLGQKPAEPVYMINTPYGQLPSDQAYHYLTKAGAAGKPPKGTPGDPSYDKGVTDLFVDEVRGHPGRAAMLSLGGTGDAMATFRDVYGNTGDASAAGDSAFSSVLPQDKLPEGFRYEQVFDEGAGGRMVPRLTAEGYPAYQLVQDNVPQKRSLFGFDSLVPDGATSRVVEDPVEAMRIMLMQAAPQAPGQSQENSSNSAPAQGPVADTSDQRTFEIPLGSGRVGDVVKRNGQWVAIDRTSGDIYKVPSEVLANLGVN